MLLFFLILLALAAPIALFLGAFRELKAEKITCPTCGKSYRLVGGSAPCPKCKTRSTRTSDGKLITH